MDEESPWKEGRARVGGFFRAVNRPETGPQDVYGQQDDDADDDDRPLARRQKRRDALPLRVLVRAVPRLLPPHCRPLVVLAGGTSGDVPPPLPLRLVMSRPLPLSRATVAVAWSRFLRRYVSKC